ncbi:hypothetical protein [Chryseosolibacter indicus]|uniref:Uncharacterized protein n=1 Tax=Chryseosolibacter indicus TaxID=2782351 RepID=A0ABS5VQ01_9BACT|nr:hypothetical protein [Chryseosolibacter indicus]MBT1702929.1 hypothetical protein [Chryseosolibacter indicus]
MSQLLNASKPTIEQQIEFVRGARHHVSKEGREAIMLHEHYDLLVAIEENLIAVKNWNETFTKKLEEGSKEVNND